MIAAPTSEQQRKMRVLEAAIDKLSKSIEIREKAWKERESSPAPSRVPDGAALELHCEAAENGLTLPRECSAMLAP